MSNSNHRRLIARGRKAGLRTTELYNALAAGRPTEMDLRSGQADGNGFVSTYDQAGHLVYRPLRDRR